MKPNMRIYREEIFAGAGIVRCRLPHRHRHGERPRVWQRQRHLYRQQRHYARQFVQEVQAGWSASTCRCRCRWRSTASAAGSARCSARLTCTAPTACASTRA
ncbi:hypothetical protein M8494_30825 [Serratia ureilytica]